MIEHGVVSFQLFYFFYHQVSAPSHFSVFFSISRSTRFAPQSNIIIISEFLSRTPERALRRYLKLLILFVSPLNGHREGNLLYWLRYRRLSVSCRVCDLWSSRRSLRLLYPLRNGLRRSRRSALSLSDHAFFRNL